MRKLLIASLVSASMIPAIAQADTKNFEGLSVYGSLNHSATTVEVEAAGAEFNGLGKQSINASIGADYGLKFGATSVILLGGTFDLNAPEFLEISGGGQSIKGEFKQRWSLYAAPGLVLTQQTLLYAKLSYDSGKAELSAGGQSLSEKYHGIGYGAGIRTQLSKNQFVGVEVLRVNYNDKGFSGVNVGTGTTIGSVQFGYKF